MQGGDTKPGHRNKHPASSAIVVAMAPSMLLPLLALFAPAGAMLDSSAGALAAATTTVTIGSASQ